MRIVHLVGFYSPELGYQESYLAEQHARMGHEVHVIASDRPYPFPNIKKIMKDARARLEKEKGRASIVLSNYSDALIHLQNTSDNEAQLKKDIAFAYMSLKQYNAAVEPCNEVLANDANDTFCLDIAGIADYVSDRNSEAFEKGKKAYEISASPCRSLNLGLYYGGTGNISEAKTRIDEVIRSNKNIVLSCWSPIKSDIPVSAMDRYNLCFLNNDKTKSICRSFAAEGWVEGNVTQKTTPEQIKQEEEQKKRLAELDTSRVL